MRQQDDWLEPTRDRLRGWSRWLHATSGINGGSAGLVGGYCEYADHGQGQVPEYQDNDSEVIDRILCKVRDRDALIYQALFDYYYHHHLSTREIAESLRISKTRVLSCIKQGETMVAVWWDAIDRG